MRSEGEILATLDQDGKLEGLPFTAEMWQFCGRQFTVRTRINRVHIDGTGVRDIRNALILSEVRCDGQAHNGCQRACSLLFKDSWLTKAPPNGINQSAVNPSNPRPETAGSLRNGDLPCQGQGTVLTAATIPLAWWDLGPYIDDVVCRTYSLYEVATILLFRLNRKWRARDPIWRFAFGPKTLVNLTRMALCVLRQNIACLLRLSPSPGQCAPEATDRQAPGSSKPTKRSPALNPGDIVEVKCMEEILATLDEKEKHHGLGFCGSMLKHCGRRYRVLAPVSRLVDERTDKEVPRIRNTYLLEGAVCDGISYLGCPRACYWMWRDAWLHKVEEPEDQASALPFPDPSPRPHTQ